MKRIWVSLIMILVLLFSTGCNSNNIPSTVKDGTYVLEQTETDTGILPRITISSEDISFTYDFLSSYLSIGTYKIEGNILTMTTNDEKYKYVFLIDSDKLIFQKDESSEVNLTDDRLRIKLTDNAIFKLEK
ncbi:hypothetical protein [Clostridium sp. DL1XJH146]